jgi:hypothetical protein
MSFSETCHSLWHPDDPASSVESGCRRNLLCCSQTIPSADTSLCGHIRGRSLYRQCFDAGVHLQMLRRTFATLAYEQFKAGKTSFKTEEAFCVKRIFGPHLYLGNNHPSGDTPQGGQETLLLAQGGQETLLAQRGEETFLLALLAQYLLTS